MGLDFTKIVWLPATGSGDMGDVTDDQSVARFALPSAKLYHLVGIRGKFTGGTGTADLVIKLDHSIQSGLFDYTLFTVLAVGSTKPLHLRVPDSVIDIWMFGGGQEIVLEWTNPDPGNMTWGIEVGLIDAAHRN